MPHFLFVLGSWNTPIENFMPHFVSVPIGILQLNHSHTSENYIDTRHDILFIILMKGILFQKCNLNCQTSSEHPYAIGLMGFAWVLSFGKQSNA